MQHLTRWRTVTAAAGTAALAAGALGIAGAVSGDDRPAAIELAATDAKDQAELRLTDLSADSQASAASVTATQDSVSPVSVTQASVASRDTSPVSVRSIDSVDDRPVVHERTTQETTTTRQRSASPGSPPSPPSPPSPDSPSSPDSPPSPPSPDSPSSVDSISSVSS